MTPMKKIIYVFTFLTAGCTSLPVLKDCDQVNAIWEYYSEDRDDVSVSVALVRDGLPTFAGDPKAIYRIGHLTKFFVVEAAERLSDRGEINLEAPLTACSAFRLDPLYGRISMRELMEMRSGIPESGNDFENRGELLKWINDSETVEKTGEREREFSEDGFALFVWLLEKQTGKSIEDIIRDEISLPLKLRDTSFIPGVEKISRITAACAGLYPLWMPRGWEMKEKNPTEVYKGCSGLYSTTEDCIKFFSSSKRIRNSPLFERLKVDDVEMDCGYGMVPGGSASIFYSVNERDCLLVFRNVTDPRCDDDLKLASRFASPTR